jgi:hypothetical protein
MWLRKQRGCGRPAADEDAAFAVELYGTAGEVRAVDKRDLSVDQMIFACSAAPHERNGSVPVEVACRYTTRPM